MEQQIRNLSAKGKPVRDINSINMANGTTVGGISSNAMTPIGSDSENNTMVGRGGIGTNQSDTFADFVRDNSVSASMNKPYNQ